MKIITKENLENIIEEALKSKLIDKEHDGNIIEDIEVLISETYDSNDSECICPNYKLDISYRAKNKPKNKWKDLVIN